MASRKTTLLLLAAVVGVGGVYAAQSLLIPETPAPEQTQPAAPAIQIAAASRDLPTGTVLKESDLKWAEASANADASSMYVQGKADFSSIAGSVVRDGFRAGDPIVSSRIVNTRDQGFLAAMLSPGMRAMSVALSPTSEVAGFIYPGDRVDVILAHSFNRKDVPDLSERRVSETILQNVRVLALDQRSYNQVTDPKVAQTATLEVSKKDAEKLALAIDIASGQSGGKASLTLVLRSLAAEDPAQAGKAESDDKPSPTWDSDVSRSFPVLNGDDGLTRRVQIMRGKTTTETTFERRREP